MGDKQAFRDFASGFSPHDEFMLVLPFQIVLQIRWPRGFIDGFVLVHYVGVVVGTVGEDVRGSVIGGMWAVGGVGFDTAQLLFDKLAHSPLQKSVARNVPVKTLGFRKRTKGVAVVDQMQQRAFGQRFATHTDPSH